MDREISRNKMFNKKDEERKARKNEQDKLGDKIKEQNRIIEENDILLDKERRILDDKDLVKKQTTIVNQLNQERGKVHIDISIAESRIKDLENAQKMALGSIQELLIEKKKFDKENIDIEAKIAGRGMTEAEQKAKQIDAEKEQLKKIQNSLNCEKEQATSIMRRLEDEEKKARELLEEKMKIQVHLHLLTEQLNDAKAIASKHRDEIIKMQIRISQLQSLEERLKVDGETLTKENEFYLKKNAEFEQENEKLTQEIHATLQKIDINYLLKEVDSEDLRLLAQTNKMMTSALHNMLGKWENISKLEADRA